MTSNTIKIEKVSGTIYRFICPYCGKVYESMYEGQLIGIATLHISKHQRREK